MLPLRREGVEDGRKVMEVREVRKVREKQGRQEK